MTHRAALFAGTVLGLAAISGLGVSASAATINTANPAISSANGDSSAVTKVATRQWNPRKDGDRRRKRGGKYRYLRGGYYYASPWWQLGLPLAPGLVVGIPTPWTPAWYGYCERKYGTSIARPVAIIAAADGSIAADVQSS